MSHDTFADIEAIEPGAFVTVRVGETAYMAGIVDHVDPATRTLDLVAWETGNHALAGSLDRYDLGDSAVVAAATTYARAACPAY